MRHFRGFLVALTLFVSLGFISCKSNQTVASIPEQRHVIILSMDGFRWDYTQHANTPTLDSLRKVGSYSQVMPVFPANTFPNHYAIATGLHPDHHGVTNNAFYDKELGRILSVFEKEDCATENFWGGEPIWNTVERQGGIAHIYMWPGSEYKINGRQATVWTPYDHNLDYYKRADKVIASMSLPKEQVPNLVMWYMPEPDSAGHKHGPNSPEVIKYVEHIDQVLGYFMAKMRDTPYFDQTDIIFTADHGMAQLAPERYINMYNTVDRSKLKYYVAGTPFGFEVEEDYADELVAELNKLGHLTAYRADAIPEKFHYGTHPTRITNVIALPDVGWKIAYSKRDDQLPSGGSHGYSPYESDMQMVFFAAGPSFKKGYTQATFQNLNIYLLICKILGVEPAKNDCNAEDFSDMLLL